MSKKRFSKAMQEEAHRDKSILEKVQVQLGRGEETRYLVLFSLTPGELMALHNALIKHETDVGRDLLAFFDNAIARSKE